MNISATNFHNRNQVYSTTSMNFNFVNNERSTPSNSRQSVFNNSSYKPIEWSQVTPQQMPWAQNPSHYSQVMTFGSANFFQPLSAPSTSINSGDFQNSTTCSVPTSSDSNQPFKLKSPMQQTMGSGFESNYGNKIKQFEQSQFTGARHCKRKMNMCLAVQSKQHITEEKMAAHLSRLHISSETPILPENSADSEVNEPPTERERRLVMCEEMRRLQTESIIPSALMRRLERPCMAVMLWQPPDKASGRLLQPIPSTSTSSSNQASNDGGSNTSGTSDVVIHDSLMDNNNQTSSMNLNSNNNLSTNTLMMTPMSSRNQTADAEERTLANVTNHYQSDDMDMMEL